MVEVKETKWFKLESHFINHFNGEEVERIEHKEWKKVENKRMYIKVGRWFVDDYTAISPRIEPGWRFNEVKARMEWTKLAYEEDQNKPPDCLTAKIMANIMSSIDPDIQLTWDAPGNKYGWREMNKV